MLQKVLLVAYALAINCFAFILCMLLQLKLVSAPSIHLNIKINRRDLYDTLPLRWC
jgi:hypothetical protein